MVLPHQTNHVIIQLVLFEHGDSKIRLFHCHVQPEGRGGTWIPAATASGQRPHILKPTPSPSSGASAPSAHSPLSLSVLALLLHLLGLGDVEH